MFCPHCGKEVANDQAYCHHCGASLAVPVDTHSGGRERTSWENRENIGFLNGLLGTLRKTLFDPSQFFRRMEVRGGLIDPLLYAMIVGMAGLIFYYFWNILLRAPLQSLMTSEFRVASERYPLGGSGPAAAAILMPFLFVFWLFIASGMLHVFLLMVRGGKAGFEATFRVLSYGVSPFVLLIIPVCGMPVMALWVIVLVIIGLKEAHEITRGKAAFAVLFPFFFCVGIVILAIAVFMGAAAVSFGWLMHMSH